MKKYLKFALSIMKANIGFSIGLCLIFTLTISLIFVSSIMPTSIEKSIQNYQEEYKLPHSYIYSKTISSDHSPYNIDKVIDINDDIALDTNFKCNDNQIKFSRIFSINPNTTKKVYYFEKDEAGQKQNKNVWLTKKFAAKNNLHVGDKIHLNTGNKYKELIITALIEIPEAMISVYDDTNWCESYDYTYVFLSRDYMDELFNTKGLSNYWNFSFDTNISHDEKVEAFHNVKEKFGDSFKEGELFEDSKAIKQLKENVNAIYSLSNNFPMIVVIIATVCSLLFISQIFKKQIPQIVIFQSMGYKNIWIYAIFALYITMLFLLSFIIGAASGIALGVFCLDLFKNSYFFPDVELVISPSIYIFITSLLLILFVISLVFFLLTTKKDPALNFKEDESRKKQFRIIRAMPKKWFNIKFSLLCMFKNIFRTLTLCLCLAACIILSFIVFETIQSRAYIDSNTFSQRFNYDLLAYFDTNKKIEDISKVNNVKESENEIFFTTNMKFVNKEEYVQINAIDQNSSLVNIFDSNNQKINMQDGIVIDKYLAENNNLKIGDQVSINDCTLNITGIAQETVNFIQYISIDTAKKLGYQNINAVFIKLNNNSNANETMDDLTSNYGVKYIKVLENQKIARQEDNITISAISFVLLIISFLIGFFILCNIVLLNINNRKLDYTILISLGKKYKHFLLICFFEFMLIFVIAFAISILPAYYLTSVILDSLSSLQGYYIFINVLPCYTTTLIVTLSYICVGAFLTFYKIYNIEASLEINTWMS